MQLDIPQSPAPLLQIRSRNALPPPPPFSVPTKFVKGRTYSNDQKSTTGISLVRDKYDAIWMCAKSCIGDDDNQPCLGEDNGGFFVLLAHPGKPATAPPDSYISSVVEEGFKSKLKSLHDAYLQEIEDTLMPELMEQLDAH